MLNQFTIKYVYVIISASLVASRERRDGGLPSAGSAHVATRN